MPWERPKKKKKKQKKKIKKKKKKKEWKIYIVNTKRKWTGKYQFKARAEIKKEINIIKKKLSSDKNNN